MPVLEHDFTVLAAVEALAGVHVVEVDVAVDLLDTVIHFLLDLLGLFDGLLALVDKVAQLCLGGRAAQQHGDQCYKSCSFHN